MYKRGGGQAAPVRQRGRYEQWRRRGVRWGRRVLIREATRISHLARNWENFDDVLEEITKDGAFEYLNRYTFGARFGRIIW